MGPRLNTRLRPSAFTTIEVMVVVVILAVAAVGVALTMSSLSDFRLTAAARTVAGDINFARSEAVAAQGPVYVTFTPASGGQSGKYALASPWGKSLSRPGDGRTTVTLGKAGTDIPGVTLNVASATTVGFDLLGQPFTRDASGTEALLTTDLVIPLQSGDNEVMNVTIRAYTGEVIAVEPKSK